MIKLCLSERQRSTQRHLKPGDWKCFPASGIITAACIAGGPIFAALSGVAQAKNLFSANSETDDLVDMTTINELPDKCDPAGRFAITIIYRTFAVSMHPNINKRKIINCIADTKVVRYLALMS